MDMTTVCCLLCFFVCLYDLVLCIHDWSKVVWIYMVSAGDSKGDNYIIVNFRTLSI